MNSIGHIDNNHFPFKQNGSEIKKVKKTETDISFKDYMKRAKKVCSCFSITEADLDQFDNLEKLIKKTGASTRCTACLKDLKKFYRK
jgi:NAD(P)H-nitrite reductase large subunit